MSNQNEMAAVLENNVFGEAGRLLRDRVLPLSATAGFVLENNGNNVDFDNVFRDAVDLYNVLLNVPEYSRYQLDEIAQIAATDAFQAYAYQVALNSPNLLQGVSREDEALLSEILNRVNTTLNQRNQRDNRQYSNTARRDAYGSGGVQRSNYPTGSGGYRTQQRQPQQQRPRNNGVSSAPQRNTGNGRYGQPARGSNIGRGAGGFGQMRQYEERDQQQQQQRYERQQPPPRQPGQPDNVINIHRQPDLRQSQPVEQPQVSVMSVIQTHHHRPKYGIDQVRIAPILYDQDQHIPLYKLQRDANNNVTCVDEIILSKDSEDGKKILGGSMEGHADYLFIPRQGDDKSTDVTGAKRSRSVFGKLADEAAAFKELEDQLTKEGNGIFKAKEGAKFPEVFTKRVVNIEHQIYGQYSNNVERMFRAVEYVNQRIAPINPDINYDDLVIAANSRDILPFTVEYADDVKAIDRLVDHFKAHRNVGTCLEIMKKLEVILPTREWNTVNDLATEMVSNIGLVEFGLPEGITNFVDQVQKYISLVDAHFSRANAELLAARIYSGFQCIFNPVKLSERYTFNLDYRIVMLPLLSNDLTLSTSIPTQKTAIVSEVVMPELHKALAKQLDECTSTTLGLLLYTRDAHAIEVHRSPLGGEILIHLLN